MSCQNRFHEGPRQFPRPYPGEMSLNRISMLTVCLYLAVLNVKPVYTNQQWSFSICTPSVKQTFGNFTEMSFTVNVPNVNVGFALVISNQNNRKCIKMNVFKR